MFSVSMAGRFKFAIIHPQVSGMPERLDGADFVVSAESAVFGSDHPWVAAQYAGCGESNSAHGGVNLPAALLAGSMNVSRESGELESNHQIIKSFSLHIVKFKSETVRIV